MTNLRHRVGVFLPKSRLIALAFSMATALPTESFGANEEKIIASLRQARSRETADQKFVIQSLRRAYLESTGPSRSLVAMGLGGIYAREAPSTALQYLSLASTGLAMRPEFSPAISYYRALAKSSLGYQAESVEIIRRELSGKRINDGWNRALHAILLVNLAKLRWDSEFLSTYGAFVAKFPASKNYQRFAVRAARAQDQRPVPPTFVAALESLSLSYPYSLEASWAFRRLLALKCEDDPKAKKIAPSRDLLISLGRNASLDEGVQDLVASLLEGVVREKFRGNRKLDAVELVESMGRAKIGDRALKLALDELEHARLWRDRTLEQRILPVIARIHYNQQDYLSADRIFSVIRESFPGLMDNSKMREFLAENYARLGSHRLAAEEFRVLSERHYGNPQFPWQHFWSLYRSGNFSGAAGLLSGRAAAGSIDREGGADAAFWGARVLAKKDVGAGRAALQRIVDERGESFYGIMAALDLDGVIVAAHETKPVNDAAQQRKPKPLVFDPAVPVDDLKLVELLLDVRMVEAARFQMAGISWDDQDEEGSSVLGQFAFSVDNFRAGFSAAHRLPRDTDKPPLSLKGLTADRAVKPIWRLLFPMAYSQMVEEFGRQAGVDKFFVLSIMRTESHYNPDAQSSVGAQGLMQIMPATAVRIARLLGDATFNISDLKEPKVSIAYGSYYLEKLLRFYGGNYGLAAAAYNAGPQAVNTWIEACPGCDMAEFVESIPYRETRRYVKSTIRNLVTYRAIYNGTKFSSDELRMPVGPLPEGETLF